MTTIKRGLDLPLSGCPEQRIEPAPAVTSVALLGDDYIGMRPTMLVEEGDTVQRGQPLFEDKKAPGVIYTAPASGTVASVNRGEKRRFLSMVIDLAEDQTAENAIDFADAREMNVGDADRDAIVAQLVKSGLWPTLRTRPFGKVPEIDATPASIFVTAVDTNPHAADVALVLAEVREAFDVGVSVLSRLAEKVFVCKSSDSEISVSGNDNVSTENFDGPHPAGLPGTHIHYLDPVGPGKTVWYVNYQDVACIGQLFLSGKLCNRRVVSLAGPIVEQPRLLRTIAGANLTQLTSGQLQDGRKPRIISGSVLNGRTANAPVDFLGRYSLQVSVLEEGDEREFLGWQKPGFDKYSTLRLFASAANPAMRFDLTTSTGGSKRAMVPMGTYEKVMPLDILPTQLLRALIVGDTDQAQALGALELEEEDLALCTFVCPGKYDYGTLLRNNLHTIETEG
ncbi:MAG: Na(+)-translocating NADH-quinone reductase subunit A [Planctomycetota bacterium]